MCVLFLSKCMKYLTYRKKYGIFGMAEKTNHNFCPRKGAHKMAKERFVETYSQGVTNMTTGCGIAVLVDKDGKPVVTPIDGENQ